MQMREHACERNRAEGRERLGEREQEKSRFEKWGETEVYTYVHVNYAYGVALVSRIDKIVGLFCKRDQRRNDILQKRPIILSILLTVATPYVSAGDECHTFTQMNVHTFTQMNVHTFTHTTPTHTQINTNIRTHARTHIHQPTHQHINNNIYIHMCVYIYTCICICIYTYAYYIYLQLHLFIHVCIFYTLN